MTILRHPAPTRLWWGVWPGIAGMALLGSGVAVIGQTHHLPTLGVQAARYLVATIALVVLARAFGVKLVPPRNRDLAWVFGGAMFGLVGFNLATILGTRHAESGLLGAAVACIPIVLAVAGPLSRGARPSPRVVAGAVVVAGGAIAITGWGRGDWVGVLMAVCLIGCEAGFTIFGAKALPRMGVWSYSAATSITAAVVFAALSVALERPTVTDFVTPGAAAAITYLGVLVTAVAFVLWFTGVKRLGPGTVGLCAGAAAPAAALSSALFGAPLPPVGAWIGMGVIAAGLFIGLAGDTHERPGRAFGRGDA